MIDLETIALAKWGFVRVELGGGYHTFDYVPKSYDRVLVVVGARIVRVAPMMLRPVNTNMRGGM